MAESRRHGLAPQLGIEQILLEAQNRWLRPAEICEILQNYRKFSIAPMPPHKPSSGSLFLFDRKVLRYFRKDGHNWRKKKDGKTVKEAHERLKADSVDVLHCYYAHGEENENFQRRTYWMLEEAFMHIVLVHYLEVKVNKSSFVGIKDDEFEQLTNVDSPICSSFVSYSQLPSLNMEAGSPTSAQTIEYERAESDNHQGRHRHLPFLELQQCTDCPLTDASNLNPSSALPSQISDYDHQTVPIVSNCGYHTLAKEVMTKILNEASQASHFNSAKEPSDVTSCKEICREPLVHIVGDKQKVAADHQAKAEVQLLDSEGCSLIFPEEALNTAILLDRKMKNSSLVKQASWDIFNIEGEGLKKYDSFSRWMSKELGEVDDSHEKSSSQSYWNFIESERLEDSSMISAEQLDSYTMSPSVSQDQHFSIIDFSPSWAYAGLVTKVLITGKFLKSKKDLENCKWSCMFGDVEVPAEILADCVLRCDAPSHRPGTVPFYITCSNRLSCSEVREFEFRANHTQYMETTDLQCSSINELCLRIRLGMLLSLDYLDHSNSVNNMTPEQLNLSNKISLQLVDADDDRLYILDRNKEISVDSLKDQLLQKLFKEQLHDWLVRKIAEGDKGPCVHDKEGQGVLHLAAALDYDWAIKPMIDTGVSINFRDVQGWAALHWAAFCGRERTVVSLLTLGAAPGALTDPTPEFPSGRTPADLASVNGHKGIAGFLAESSLTAHLETLTLKCTRGFDVPEVTRTKDMVGFVENYDDDAQDGAAMKESLSAVRNATHAAACIHQVFRVQSFQRKKSGRYGAVSDEETFSLISIRTNKPGHNTPSHSAAICIQNKFRGWKGRKEFLIIRQRIVKIQAYARGYQVRKQYKKIVWTVGILEKVILRWRRKRSGLRGFRSEGLLKSTSDEAIPPKEGEYDFLQDGRKQTEVRLQKALVRVRSMVQYPEARDQYCRLATIVSELQHSKALHDESSNEAKDAAEGDLMMEFEELFDEDPSAQTS